MWRDSSDVYSAHWQDKEMCWFHSLTEEEVMIKVIFINRIYHKLESSHANFIIIKEAKYAFDGINTQLEICLHLYDSVL